LRNEYSSAKAARGGVRRRNGNRNLARFLAPFLVAPAIPGFIPLLVILFELGGLRKEDFIFLVALGRSMAIHFTFLAKPVIAAYLGACFINAATVVGHQIHAAIPDLQIPFAVIHEDMDLFMHQVPAKVFEILLTSGGVNLKGEVAAADGRTQVARWFSGSPMDKRQLVDKA
jgi:hypothetical protein